MTSTIDSRLQVSFEQGIRECIQTVSPSSYYQYKLIAFFALVALNTTLQVFSSSLFYMNPAFLCEGSADKVFEEDACPQIKFCQIINTETITAELSLYCDSRKYDRTLLQTGMGIGCWIGIILTVFSDRLGKKSCFCLSLLLLNLTWLLQFAGVYYSSVTLLFLSEVNSGIFNKSIYVSFLVLLTRFLKKDAYELGTLVWYIAFHGMSQMVVAGVDWAFHDWRALAYVYSAGILACSVAALFVLQEDPLFLFDIGRITQLKRVVGEVGRQNGASWEVIQRSMCRIDELFELKMERIESGRCRQHFNIWEIVRWDVMRAVFVIGLAGACYQMAYKSIELSLQGLEFSYNFNLFVLGISGVCGFSVAIYVTRMEPQRRRGLICSSMVYGVVALLFLFPFCYQNGIVETMVIFILRVLLCWSCNFYTRLKVDYFPERYQMTIIGLVQSIATIGLVAAPTAVQSSIDHGVSPIVSINFIRIVIGTLPLFLYVEQRIHLGPDDTSSDEDPKDDKILAF